MDTGTIILVLALVGLTYWLAKPIGTKKSPGRPRKPKPFGKGMFIDTDGANWWKPGDGGI